LIAAEYTSAPLEGGALAISLAVQRDQRSCIWELTLRREHWGEAHVGDVRTLSAGALGDTRAQGENESSRTARIGQWRCRSLDASR